MQHIDNPINNIEKCYNYFKDNINADKLHLPTLSRRITFVGVYLHEHEDEQQIFDTINSLGVRLTTAELLKNTLLKPVRLSLMKNTGKNYLKKTVKL